MGLEHVAPSIEAHNTELVMRDTWGHLAPQKNVTYPGYFTMAIGIYDSGELNPTILECNFGDLANSPWFYEAIHEFTSGPLREKYGSKAKDEPYPRWTCGHIYRFDGHFRNYKFVGKLRRLVLVKEDRRAFR